MSTGYTIVWAATAVVLCIWSLATPNVGGWGGIVSFLMLVALFVWRNGGGSGRPNPTATGKRDNTIDNLPGALKGVLEKGVAAAAKGVTEAVTGAKPDAPATPAAPAAKPDAPATPAAPAAAPVPAAGG